MRYTVSVEPDGAIAARGKWMVVISDDSERVVGIPLRGVSKRAAEDAARPVRDAFDFGYTAARTAIFSMPTPEVVAS